MRKLTIQSLAAVALMVGAGCIAEREPLSPPSTTSVRMGLRVNLQVSSAGERVVEIRARYRRVNGEQPTLPVQPTQVVIEDGATIEQAVTIDIGPCNSDATRVREGNEGCRFTIELTLKNGAGETLSSDEEDVGPVGQPGTQAVPTFVLSTPNLTLDPVTLAFAARAQQGMPAAQTVAVNTNIAGATLGTLSTAIEYANGQGWLTTTLNQGAHTVGVQPNTTGLAVGTYRATVTVASSVDGMKPQTLAVTYQVTQQPTLVVTGTGDGSGTVASLPGGISCTIRSGVTSGTCSALFEPNATVTLTADPSGSDRFGGWSGPCAGQGSCVVTLAQSASVGARFNSPAPVLQLSPTSVSFTGLSGGTNPARQTVSVVNGGGGTLTGIVVSSITYPSVPPSLWLDAFISGNTVSVGATPANLPAGTYTGSIAIGSANGGSATLGVTIVVSPRPPVLRLNPTSLAFSGVSGRASPPRQNVSAVNDGGGILAGVTINSIRYGGSESPWLTATVSGGTITVGADPSKLLPGNYTATVVVGSSNGGNANLSVTFAVAAPPPILTVTPDTMTFIQGEGIPVPPPKSARASNTGTGTLGDLGRLGVDGNNTTSWLRVSLDGNLIVVTAVTGNLARGVHKGIVTITSTRGGNAIISVTFHVGVIG